MARKDDDEELGEQAAGGTDDVVAKPPTSYLGTTPRHIMCRFIMFAVFFSLNHGCVTGVLAYVQVFFGSVAQISVATLYGFYTGTALLLAAVIIDWATYKYALLGGLILYCMYVACYAIGGGFPSVQVPVIVTGAAIGGFSAGFLWTAQGPYFKAFAEEYAKVTQSPVEKATGLLAGIFAFCYLGCEVLLKLAAKPAFEVPAGEALTLQSPGVVGLFCGYALVSIVSCIGIMFIPDIPIPINNSRTPWYTKIVSVLKLVFTNPRAVLLGPAQASFGLCSELMGLYVSVELTECSGNFGVNVFPNLPWMATSIPALAAVLQLPVGLLVKAFGQVAVSTMMILGQLSFVAMGAICVFVDRDSLAGWGYGLMSLYALQGIGRAAYEGANRATYANMFKSEDSSAAFATITLFGGLASTVAYAVFKDLIYTDDTPNCTYNGATVKNYDGTTIGWICFITGLVGLAGYLVALILDTAGKKKEKAAAIADAHGADTGEDYEPLAAQ